MSISSIKKSASSTPHSKSAATSVRASIGVKSEEIKARMPPLANAKKPVKVETSYYLDRAWVREYFLRAIYALTLRGSERALVGVAFLLVMAFIMRFIGRI